MSDSTFPWNVEVAGPGFAKFLKSLPEYEQAVLLAAIDHVLKVHGQDVCAGEWGKPLGGGLYEFRVRKSLRAILDEASVEVPDDVRRGDRQVLLRLFCSFFGDRVVLLVGGYDKKKDPSPRRQEREIARARKLLREWKQGVTLRR